MSFYRVVYFITMICIITLVYKNNTQPFKFLNISDNGIDKLTIKLFYRIEKGGENDVFTSLQLHIIIIWGLWVMVLNATFNNISVIPWRSVLLVLLVLPT